MVKKHTFFIIVFICLLPFNIHTETLTEIIDNFIRFDDWSGAKVQLENFIKSNPTNPHAYSLYASTLTELNLLNDSIKALKNAIYYEKAPDKKSKYYFDLGRVYYSLKSFDIASKNFSKSIQFDDFLSSSYYFRGVISYKNDKIDDAIDDWESYIKLSTNNIKKQKLRNIIALLQKNAADRARLEEEKKLREQALFDKITSELESDVKDFEEYKVKKRKSDDEDDFEERE